MTKLIQPSDLTPHQFEDYSERAAIIEYESDPKTGIDRATAEDMALIEINEKYYPLEPIKQKSAFDLMRESLKEKE